MLTYYAANKFIDSLSGGGANLGTAIYIGLSSTSPSRDGTGVTEPDAGKGYKRSLITHTGTSQNMDIAALGAASNKEIIFFSEATQDWPTCTHFVLYDAPTGGNLLAYGSLTAAITPTANTVPIVRVGNFTMSIS